MSLPVLLLHGQPGTASVYDAVVAELASAAVEVRALDRPGYGSTQGPALGVAGNAAWLLGEIRRRSPGRALVVAHSWAALPAILAAATEPDLVAGLLLLAPAGPGAVTRFDRVLAWAPLGPAFGARRIARSFRLEQRAMITEMPAVQAALLRLRVPTRVLVGSHDRLIAVGAMVAVARAIRDARLEVLPGAGHALPARRPDEITAAVLAMLAELDPGPSGGSSWSRTASR